MQGHLKCSLWRLTSPLTAEHKFNCGITGLRKPEKMSMTMLVLVARARTQAMQTLKHREVILDNHRITIKEAANDVGISFGSSQVQEISTNVLGMKRTAAKIVPKLLNFEQKQRRMGIAQILTTFHDNRDLLEKVITGDESGM